MAQALRAVEQPTGDWLCWFGAECLAVMPDEASAVAHLSEVARARSDGDLFEMYLHRLDGSVALLPFAST